MKKEMVEIQQNVVQNQTAVMIEIGTSLLNQTAAQTRKLTDVEAQVSGRRNPGAQQLTRVRLWLAGPSDDGKLQTLAVEDRAGFSTTGLKGS